MDEGPAAPALPVPATPTETTPSGPHLCTRRDPPDGVQGRTDDLAVSRADPDAGLVSRGGVPLALYHKVHLGVDGGVARIITALDVTPGDIADEDLPDRICKEHEGTTGRTAEEVIAATKYGTVATYALLEAQGKRASIPPHLAGDQDRAVPREQFVYDSAHDRSVCPQGQPLTRQGVSCTGTASRSIISRASPKVCSRCPLKEACCGSARARTISRPDDGGLSDRVRTYLDPPTPNGVCASGCTGWSPPRRAQGAPRAPAGAGAGARRRADPSLRRRDGLQY